MCCDTCLLELSIEGNFWRMVDYLILCSQNGIMFNLPKFQFCQREVEFVGYWLTEDGMKPTKSLLEAILNFPRPMDISGVRGFFSLVEQVAWAFSKKEVMLSFREPLKKGSTFCWSHELQDAFEKVKEKIVDLVKEGVKSFQINRVTVVNTDWSKIGVGFTLLQKHCSCYGVDLNCCREGWKLCLVGS